jgi:hypothetical protein
MLRSAFVPLSTQLQRYKKAYINILFSASDEQSFYAAMRHDFFLVDDYNVGTFRFDDLFNYPLKAVFSF